MYRKHILRTIFAAGTLLVSLIFLPEVFPDRTSDIGYDYEYHLAINGGMGKHPEKGYGKLQSIGALAWKRMEYGEAMRFFLGSCDVLNVKAENADRKIYQSFLAAIKIAPEPSRQILHGLLGKYLLLTAGRAGSGSSGPARTFDRDPHSIAHWTSQMRVGVGLQHLEQSLTAPELQARTPASRFEWVMDRNGGAFSRGGGNSVLDGLTLNVLHLLERDEIAEIQPNSGGEPVDIFNAPGLNELLELPQKPWKGLSFSEIGQQCYATIFQQHRRTDPEALALLEMDRLGRLYTGRGGGKEDSAYLHGLDELLAVVGRHQAAAYPMGAKARQLTAMGRSRKRTTSDADRRKYLEEALETCQECLDRHYEGHGADNCKSIYGVLNQGKFRFAMPPIVQADREIPARGTYTLTPTIHFRLLRLDFPTWVKMRNDYDNNAGQLRKRSPMRTWTWELPHASDRFEHEMMGSIPALPSGFYCLLISDQSDFPNDDDHIHTKYFQSTSLMVLDRSPSSEHDRQFMVVDRATGEPKPEAELQQIYFPVDSSDFRLVTQTRLDAQGSSYYPSFRKSSHRETLAILGEDSLIANPKAYPHEVKSDEAYEHHLLFTDRGIYRPGQTLHVKGIVLERLNRKLRILPGKDIEVTLRDANYTEIATRTFRTNVFGSFAATFTLPKQGLTGQFQLTTRQNGASFRVEDYKRPRFEAKIDPLKESYRLGDSITVTGHAKTYAGSVVDGAKVKYVVQRSSGVWPWWGYASWLARPARPAQKRMAYGEVKTDEEGKFSITFAARPAGGQGGASVDFYDFAIEATVTDRAGETQQATKNIRLGRADLEIQLKAKGLADKAKLTEWELSTKTLAGRATPAKLAIRFFALKAPNRVVLPGNLVTADQFLPGEAKFFEAFPCLARENEIEWRSWKKGKQVREINAESDGTYRMKLDELASLPEGVYEMQIETEDSFGSAVMRSHRFLLTDTRTTEMPGPLALWVEADRTRASVGEKVNLLIGSAFRGARIMLELYRDEEVILSKNMVLDSAKMVLPIQVKPDLRGGFDWRVSMVREGILLQETGSITVPYENRELKIAFTTFRSKLLPGESETWTLKVTRRDGKPVSAEVMASLYDASLDAIYEKLWTNFPQYQRGGFRKHLWYGGESRLGYGEGFEYEPEGHFPEYSLPEMIAMQSWNFIPWFGNLQFSDFSMDDADLNYYKRGRGDFAAQLAIPDSSMLRSEGFVDLFSGGTPPPPPGNGLHFNVNSSSSPALSRPGSITIRKALQELAFFKPLLRTNSRGEVTINFTIPESLTRWKFRVYAHTKDVAQARADRETVTQKPLMVIPHLPRFLRVGDRVSFSARISNLTDSTATGKAELELLDAATMKPVGREVLPAPEPRDFSIEPGQSLALDWEINAPDGPEALIYRIVAYTRDFSDGEEAAIPLLPNRTLVTEALALPVRAREEKEFTFVALQNSTSTTLKHHRLSLEFTSNPAWNAVLALPYLMEFPHECAEQTFSRYYANALAHHIVKSHPRIGIVLNKWKNESPETLLSNLEKRQDLKMLLLEETPWVIQAHSETERRRRVGMLLDLNRMASEQEEIMQKLRAMQLSDGSFPWFSGMAGNPFITSYIVAGMGHLRKLGVTGQQDEPADVDVLQEMLKNAVQWLDARMLEAHNRRKSMKSLDLNTWKASTSDIQYLYARSFFPEIELNAEGEKAHRYLLEQAMIFWNKYSLYTRIQIALVAFRNGHEKLARQIVDAQRVLATRDEHTGMYWKDNVAGFYWNQAPIETQALLIEAFREIENDEQAVEEMRLWLLKEKQLQDWGTTKATTEACYALLMGGTDYLSMDKLAVITVGGQKINRSNYPDLKTEAGTGQISLDFPPEQINAEMAAVIVQNPNNIPAWGAMYWQYFEEFDKIEESDSSALRLHRQMFKKVMTESGNRLQPLGPNTVLQAGDVLTVRLDLHSDRSMDFVHLKDQRPAGLEPINQLSGLHWSGGLRFYRSPRDAATHFFIDRLLMGSYVFEYDLRVAHTGQFSGGQSLIECMYAPEFRAHSAGQRLVVD